MKIEWVERKGKKFLHFSFNEHLTEQEAKDGVEKWKSLMDNNSGKVSIIWDCKIMKGYDANARAIWQETLTEEKNSVEVIWFISDSSLIKMGASVMSIMMPFKIINISSESEIK